MKNSVEDSAAGADGAITANPTASSKTGVDIRIDADIPLVFYLAVSFMMSGLQPDFGALELAGM